MLYALKLPDITKECLADLVWLQMDLLDYAATTMRTQWAGLKDEAVIAHLRKEGSNYLGNYGTRCKSYGERIAKIFFTGKLDAKEGRVSLLKTFANAYRLVPDVEGKKWRKRLRDEIASLFSDDQVLLRIEGFYDPAKRPQMLEMQKAAANFLLYFYDFYLGSIDAVIPKEFLTWPDLTNFGRQDMIEAFHDKNIHLEICAMCDESRYYTKYQDLKEKKGPRKNVIKTKTHTILDHYFPKNTYPHLCCHPYNLIPVCYACNSSVKGAYDPLKELHAVPKSTLPYRSIKLKEEAYLRVKPGRRAELVKIVGLFPRPGMTDPAIEKAINMLGDIYKLPDRWSEKTQTLRITDTLFRRMRHFLGNGTGNPLGTDMADEIYNMLKQLLYYLDFEDQQKDPFAFAMTWILASMLKTKDGTQAGDQSAWDSLVAEINSWFGQDLTESCKRNEYAEKLIGIIEPIQ